MKNGNLYPAATLNIAEICINFNFEKRDRFLLVPGKMIVEFFSAYSNLEKRCGNIYIYDLMCLDVVSIIYSPISCSRFANTSTAKKKYMYNYADNVLFIV